MLVFRLDDVEMLLLLLDDPHLVRVAVGRDLGDMFVIDCKEGRDPGLLSERPFAGGAGRVVKVDTA